jgi:hypothetical protein
MTPGELVTVRMDVAPNLDTRQHWTLVKGGGLSNLRRCVHAIIAATWLSGAGARERLTNLSNAVISIPQLLVG